jgi:hypothetical protein
MDRKKSWLRIAVLVDHRLVLSFVALIIVVVLLLLR